MALEPMSRAAITDVVGAVPGSGIKDDLINSIKRIKKTEFGRLRFH
jgi:hypothetical protein